jgi:hypothetical protein
MYIACWGRYFEKDRHRTSTKFGLGVIKWVHELFKRPSYFMWSLCVHRLQQLVKFVYFIIINNISQSRDSSVCKRLATGWMIGVGFPAGAGNFPLHHRVQTGSGAHPASYPMCTGGSFPGVKWPGREADHSPPSSADVKDCVELYLHSSNTSSWRDA